MILELPEAGAWTISDLEKLDTGDFHLELDEGQLLVMPAARYPWFAIVIEVASSATSAIDYNAKPGKYAEGGIPEYWIVDRHPDDDRDALVHIHHLVRGGEGGVYRLDRTIPLSKLEQE